MNAATILQLSALVADVVETDGADASHVEMGECADGSRRYYALVTTHACGLEQVYRVATAAPDVAPDWARRAYPVSTTELRHGDSWLTLEEV